MPEKRIGHIIKINGNMVVACTSSLIIQNEVVYIIHGAERLYRSSHPCI